MDSDQATVSDLLSYYNRELAYLRNMGAEFSERHPKIAGRLRLDATVAEDPHVSRLIESFAFLTAKIRKTLDEGAPELSEALMVVLNPAFSAPIPSVTIMRFTLAKTVLHSQQVPAKSMLYADVPQVGRCFYRTWVDTWLLPLTVKHCVAESLPLCAPPPPASFLGDQLLQSCIQVTVAGNSETGDTSLVKLAKEAPLRFFINAQPQIASKLYEYLFYHLLCVGVVDDKTGEPRAFLSPSVVRSANFDLTDTTPKSDWHRPVDSRVSVAQTLLSDLFCCPQLFLFFDLTEISPYWELCQQGIRLVFYFSRVHPELIQGVTHDTLQLGCCPATNLFEASAHAVSATSHDREQLLMLDPQTGNYGDIQSIKSVSIYSEAGEKRDIPPLYGQGVEGKDIACQGHGSGDQAGGNTYVGKGLYWVARREPSDYFRGALSRGTETYLSIVDERHSVADVLSEGALIVEVDCNNRDLPLRLPFGPDEPCFSFFGKEGGGIRVKCMIPPTPTLPPLSRQTSQWALVTQLSLQSFAGPEGLATLKHALALHDRSNTRENQSVINGILELTVTPVFKRFRQAGKRVHCSGTGIGVVLDEQFYSGVGVYLFGSVLSEFFSQFCTLNTFTQLTITVQQRPEESYIWPPRAGCQALL